MTETRQLSLGGRTFDVPRLPLGVTIQVYPICQRLTNAGLVQRLLGLDESEPLALSAEEMGDLTELAFQCARVADETLDTQAFLALPVTPPELFAAFYVARVQCGGWRPIGPEDGDGPGEEQGASTPPTSTSTASSPASSATTTSRLSTGSRKARSRTGRTSTAAS